MGIDSVLIVLGVTARKDEDLHMIARYWPLIY